MTRRSAHIRSDAAVNAIEAVNSQTHRIRWYSWPRPSSQSPRSLRRPRFFLVAVSIIVITTIYILYLRQGDDLGDKLNALVPLRHLLSPVESLDYLGTPKPSLVGNPHGSLNSSEPHDFKELKAPGWTKPEGIKIIALIFYGRRETVSILDCYLKQNLVSNGGFLDEVHWAVNTWDPNNLKYLNRLVKTSDSYVKVKLPDLGFDNIWKHAVKRGNLYIKIDDDVVYIHPDAIPKLIYTKLKHPDAFAVSANVVNSPSLSWLHFHLGAVHSYLPEAKPPGANGERSVPETWRPSFLPDWHGDQAIFPLGKGTNDAGLVEPDDPGAPPYQGHRWLPLRDKKNSIMRSPISQTEFDAYGNGLKSWAIAAQQHYSLLQNIETGEIDRYYFGRTTNEYESIYTMGDSRMNINFLCVSGDDVVDNFPFPNVDEPALTWDLPQKLQRPMLINTRALIAHFSYQTQHDLFATDLLSRYKTYADEVACKLNNK